jgi:hypothetical protein
MVQTAGERKPVVHAKKGKQKDNHSSHGSARKEQPDQPGKQSANQRYREKENRIHYWGNPEDLSGDMHHRTPASPIKSLENEKACGLDEAGRDSPTHTEHQKPGNAWRRSILRSVFQVTIHRLTIAAHRGRYSLAAKLSGTFLYAEVK